MGLREPFRLLPSKPFPISFFFSHHGNGFKLIVCSVGAHFIYGSWYTQAELGKRAAVFCGFGNLGNMAGGWIQAALLGSLSDKGGLPPWRWMFIVVSVMTIPFALFGQSLATRLPRKISTMYESVSVDVDKPGWFVIPDLPHHRAARFLTEEEKECAIRRLGASRKQSWDLTVFRRVLLSWQFWLLPTVFMRTCSCPKSLPYSFINNIAKLMPSSLLPLRAIPE